MDDLNTVRDLLSAPSPSPQVTMEGRARLLASLGVRTTAPNAGENFPPATATRSRSRRSAAEAARRDGAPRTARWTALGTGLLATAAAVTVVIASGSAPDSPDSITLAQPSSASASPGLSTRPGAAPSARQILLAAATSVAKTSADGDYWVKHVVVGGTEPAPNGKYRLRRTWSQELWASPAAGEPTWRISQFLGAKPAGPEDEKAWRADGSPKTWTYPAKQITTDGKSTVVPGRTVTSAPGAREAQREDAGGSLGTLAGGEPMTPDRLDRLPATPEGLRDYLEKVVEKTVARGGMPPLGKGENTDQRLYDLGVTVIMHFPVSPQVRAAAYRMLASLPTVTALGEVTDALGRRGRAVGIPRTAALGASEGAERLVVDTETGLPLALEYTDAPDWSRQGAAVLFYEALKESRWTDEKPDLPAKTSGPKDAAG
ncbi:CU044_5270 family protein [Sinosporangium siamense]|uniref:CU044_5270 family protein n=1 Tax=Sinosporangium siamense TaxID=1367973 RepID=A0A919RNR9_9ACTN|nr:CU044_5270 family protein [Sinosporangium siamense]GII96245.1 hypothetical protein Ssi02_64760 [Sinosporangium siamense]